MRSILVALSATLLAGLSATSGSAHPGHRHAAPAGPPAAAFQLRLGHFMPTGDSNFWDETEAVFTLDADDFDGFAMGFSYVRPFSNYVEIGVNLDLFEETARSEVRGFVDAGGFAILHDTELSIVPLTFDVRLVPGGRHRIRPGGRQILKPVFYVGAGAGFTFWEYEEFGDFVDFAAMPPAVIFGDFHDDGVAFEVHGLAGLEIPVGRATSFLFEGRYSMADDDLGGDFEGLQSTKLDVGGRAFYAGLSFRF